MSSPVRTVLFNHDIFSTGQVARLLGVASRTVSKWIDAGKLRGHRLPGSQDRRIRREDLITFAREHGLPCGLLRTVQVICAGVPAHLVPVGTRTASSLFDLALTLDREAACHVLVLDASLGRSQCQAVAPLLRQTLPRVHLVVLPCEDDADPDSWLEAGYNQVLSWPVSPDRLAAVLEEAIHAIA